MTQRTTPARLDQAGYATVHTNIVALLEAARRTTARSVNAVMTASYWVIGRRIVEFAQGRQARADHGGSLLARLATDLTTRFGRGFIRQNLQQMRVFHLAWPADKICQTLSGKSASPQVAQLVVDLKGGQGSNEAHFTREGLSNKVLTTKYRTALADEQLLADKLGKAWRMAHGGDVEGGA